MTKSQYESIYTCLWRSTRLILPVLEWHGSCALWITIHWDTLYNVAFNFSVNNFVKPSTLSQIFKHGNRHLFALSNMSKGIVYQYRMIRNSYSMTMRYELILIQNGSLYHKHKISYNMHFAHILRYKLSYDILDDLFSWVRPVRIRFKLINFL